MANGTKTPVEQAEGQLPEVLAKYKRTRNTLTVILVILLLLLPPIVMKKFSAIPTLEPDYNLIKPDENAVQIDKDTEPVDRPGPVEGGGSMSLVFSDEVSLNQNTGTVSVYYQNPAESDHNVVLQVIVSNGDKRYLVAQSGVLEPGYMVTELAANQNMGVNLVPGGYNGVFKLLFYDMTTGERAMVDTEIPIKLAVR